MKDIDNSTLLKHVINELPSPFVVKDFNGKFVLTNIAVAKLYGVDNPADMIGKDDGDYIPDKKQAEFFKKNIQDIIKSGKTQIVYEDSTDVDTGEVRHYMSIKKPFKNSENEDYILVIANDITQIKRAEKILLKYEKILSVSYDFLSYQSKDGIYEAVNDAYLNAFGIKREDIIGKSQREILGDEHYVKNILPNFQKALKGENSSYESWVDFPTSGKRFVQVTYHPYMLEGTNSIEGVVVQVYDLTERKIAEDKLQHIAHHDPLTGLANRRMFSDILKIAISRAKRANKKIAVMFLDLDRFKIINDSLGHVVGDKMLQKVAMILEQRIRSNDTVARSGGDEFLILLDGFKSINDIANICESILSVLRKPIIIEKHALYVTASIGISIFPNDALCESDLIQSADTAMYEAKKLGRNTFQLSNEDLRKYIYERFVIENKLRLSIKNKELEIYYQPFVDTFSKKLLGVEALLRWNQADGSIYMPDKFIHIAEESGLIIPIGRWVIEEACLQMKKWIDKGYAISKISVNVSGNQLLQANFVEIVKNALDNSNLLGIFLELEITESYLMHDTTEVLKTLNQLNELGVSISIDDFGTGYSSLKYLQLLPISKLKIDRSFIQNTPENNDDVAIVKTMISLAKNLHMDVVAEGVETKEQADFLNENGCNYLQGFLFDKPIRIKELEDKYFLSGLCR